MAGRPDPRVRPNMNHTGPARTLVARQCADSWPLLASWHSRSMVPAARRTGGPTGVGPGTEPSPDTAEISGDRDAVISWWDMVIG